MDRIIGGIIFLTMVFGILGCQKDYSVETYQAINTDSTTTKLATGSLQDVNGNCQNITVNGNYIKGAALNTSNYITVTVNFTGTGKYKVYTNTVNGCWFSMDTTITNNLGAQTIRLQGYGTPLDTGTFYLTVTFLNTSCSFSLLTDTLSADTDYLPLTQGTYWAYDTLANVVSVTPNTVYDISGLKDTVRYTVTNQTQTINGKTYTLSISSNKDTAYYRKDYQGHYYRYFNGLQASTGLAFEYMILDESKNVNAMWATPNYTVTAPQPFGNITTYLQCQIISKNQPLTVFNKTLNTSQTFDSVIHVEETLFIAGASPYAPFGSFEAYYAKKVGLVEYTLPGAPVPINYFLRSWQVR